jgi:hypothetical protein
MRFLLDTNTCIAYLTRRSAKVKERFEQTPPADRLSAAGTPLK